MSAPDLSALISARFCHDLISPLGAIGNGLELLQMTGGAGEAEIDLISNSLANALAKLRFYRVAFGPADPEARLSLDEAGEVTRNMYNGRFTVSWSIGGKSLSREQGKLVFLAILCLEKSLPMGGLVRVSAAEDTIALDVEGPRTAPPVDLWAHVTDGSEVAAARSDNVQFPVLRKALDEAGHSANVMFRETGALLRLKAPAPQPV